MTKIKKIISGTLVAVAVSISTLCFGASALEYSDSKSWQLYQNTHVSHTIEDYKLNYYTGGYKAVITDKEYGGSYNYITVSQGNIQKAMLTEKNVACKTFKGALSLDDDGDAYSAFRVEMHAEDIVTKTPYNNGEIKLSNLF